MSAIVFAARVDDSCSFFLTAGYEIEGQLLDGPAGAVPDGLATVWRNIEVSPGCLEQLIARIADNVEVLLIGRPEHARQHRPDAAFYLYVAALIELAP
jgi:hypothetical protein